MNYKYENGIYIADEGYCFKSVGGMLFVELSLATDDSIENYECIEIPQDEEDETPDSEVLDRISEVLNDEE